MQWAHVGQILNNYWCDVIYETSDGKKHHRTGKIICSSRNTLPILRNMSDTAFMTPPPYAIVINLMPELPPERW
jgi:hypothetical protein